MKLWIVVGAILAIVAFGAATSCAPSVKQVGLQQQMTRLDLEELTVQALDNHTSQLVLLEKTLALTRVDDRTSWHHFYVAFGMAQVIATDYRTTSRGDYGHLLGSNVPPELTSDVMRSVAQAARVNQESLRFLVNGEMADIESALTSGEPTQNTTKQLDHVRSVVHSLTETQAKLANFRANAGEAQRAAEEAVQLNLELR